MAFKPGPGRVGEIVDKYVGSDGVMKSLGSRANTVGTLGSLDIDRIKGNLGISVQTQLTPDHISKVLAFLETKEGKIFLDKRNEKMRKLILQFSDTVKPLGLTDAEVNGIKEVFIKDSGVYLFSHMFAGVPDRFRLPVSLEESMKLEKDLFALCKKIIS